MTERLLSKLPAAGRSRLARWQGFYRLNPTFGTIAQHHVPALGLNDGPSDGKAQTDTACIAAAGYFKTHEGFKDGLKLEFGQSRPVVCDGDDGKSCHLVKSLTQEHTTAWASMQRI